jgi:hypothetical protein
MSAGVKVSLMDSEVKLYSYRIIHLNPTYVTNIVFENSLNIKGLGMHLDRRLTKGKAHEI